MKQAYVAIITVCITVVILSIFGVHFSEIRFISNSNCTDEVLYRGQVAGGIWDVENCTFRWRSMTESLTCMDKLKESTNKTVRIAFIGDSRIRQLRDGLVMKLTGVDRDWLANKAISYDEHVYKKHEDSGMHIPSPSGENISVEFVWDTGIDDADFGRFVETTLKEPLNSRPHLVVFGVGLWPIRVCTRDNRTQPECVKDYKRNLARFLPRLKELANHSAVFWAPQNPIIEGMWPGGPTDREFKNQFMEMYNAAAYDVIQGSNIVYWSSYVETSRLFSDTLDGVHLGYGSKQTNIQIILNYLCNPLDKPILPVNVYRTTVELFNSFKLTTLLFFAVLVISIAVIIHICRKRVKS